MSCWRRSRKRVATVLLSFAIVISNQSFADKERDITRLLRVSRTQQQFEAAALAQTREILRTYQSIVYHQIRLNLPETLRREIINCYNAAYSWDQFEPGIVDIMVAAYEEEEIELLTNYYSNRSVAPMKIDALRKAMTKTGEIQHQSAEFIYSKSESCLDRDVELIVGFVKDVEGTTSASQKELRERLVPELFRRARLPAPASSQATD